MKSRIYLYFVQDIIFETRGLTLSERVQIEMSQPAPEMVMMKTLDNHYKAKNPANLILLK